MKREQASSTADMTAMVRAHEHLYADGEVFDDPFALALTSPGWQRVLRSRTIKTLVIDGLLRPFRGGAAVVLGRARYLEDQLPRLMKEGCTQYVVVGAGMDSFALRRPVARGAPSHRARPPRDASRQAGAPFQNRSARGGQRRARGSRLRSGKRRGCTRA